MEQTYSTTSFHSLNQILAKLPKPKSNAASVNSTKKTPPNCQNCLSLDHCQYPNHRGYSIIHTEYGTALSECQYLRSWKTHKRRNNLLAESNLPIQYRNLTFNDFTAHNGNYQALVAALELNSLYLWGNSNTGKTLLLTLIGNAHINANRRVLYTTSTEMLLQLRYNSDTCETRLQQYQTTPILLIDDLGTERVTEYGEEQLYMVLDGRRRHGKTTVMSSHLSLKNLTSIYNERLRERIKQTVEREEHIQ